MSEPKIRVLVSLHKGYGLGDAVQMSAVLRHLKKHRPNWRIDYRAEEGKHQVGRGIVDNTFAYGEPSPTPHYDAEVPILLFDTWSNWHDRPNTRVSSCLHERFGLDWDAECGRYVVNVSEPMNVKAHDMLRGKWEFGARYNGLEPRWVAVHYKGDSSPDKKNLSDEQADKVCDHILSLGRVPLLLDWRNTCSLSNRTDICTTGRTHISREWGGNAEANVAVIDQCEAFVGIDSGPSKCASATSTPALVTWTGHHPAPFHDPAPNTTHLVPVGYHGLDPVCNDPGVIAWFEAHHTVRTYERDPIEEIKRWLTETLK